MTLSAHNTEQIRGGNGGEAIEVVTTNEKARIMHAELTDHRIERHHLRREIGGYADSFPGREDVELIGVEHDVVGALRGDDFICGIS